MEVIKTIGGRKFTLSKVNIRMRRVYSELTNLGADLTMVAEESTAITDDSIIAGEPENAVDRAKQRAHIRAQFRDLDKWRRVLTGDIIEKRDDLLKAILVKNGYQYDPEFWDEEADTEDLNDIVTGIFKQAPLKK
jgi:hypothetical protein